MRDRAAALLPSRFLRFAVSGGIAAAVNVISRVVLSQRLDFSLAIVIAYLLGMTVAFVLMKLLVFEASGKSVQGEYLRFGIVNVIALVQVWAVSLVLARWLFPLVGFAWHPETVAHTIGVLSPIATSYVGHRSFTFR